MFENGDIVKVVKREHSRFGHVGVFLHEYTVPNIKLEKPLFKVLIDGEIRLMLLNELERIK